MSGMVTLKQGDTYYKLPLHEYVRYWSPHVGVIGEDEEFLHVDNVPYKDIPTVSVKAALKRGKGVKRVVKAYSAKGSGKHANENWR